MHALVSSATTVLLDDFLEVFPGREILVHMDRGFEATLDLFPRK
jgi:hypothetical protein